MIYWGLICDPCKVNNHEKVSEENPFEMDAIHPLITPATGKQRRWLKKPQHVSASWHTSDTSTVRGNQLVQNNDQACINYVSMVRGLRPIKGLYLSLYYIAILVVGMHSVCVSRTSILFREMTPQHASIVIKGKREIFSRALVAEI